MNQIERRLRDFINNAFFYSDEDIPSDVALIPSGKVDSTGFLEIVVWVEDTFGFAVPDADVTEANWGGINRMVAYIERRLAERGEPRTKAEVNEW